MKLNTFFGAVIPVILMVLGLVTCTAMLALGFFCAFKGTGVPGTAPMLLMIHALLGGIMFAVPMFVALYLKGKFK